ncbi:hypothetical protein [Bradyrhizobium sp. CCGB20]|uniref:hypothetical protein n=1 Tax=Bradyrhizobium sp. CCGB20 TaxID=2949633 RepID=UPI0020B21B61|nr:hypothetical protein [Bradyrhizobium sp. CCGB20]MCP3397083.1 hypothetical protein [Bradyrhizobium sp. CCGB20]
MKLPAALFAIPKSASIQGRKIAVSERLLLLNQFTADFDDSSAASRIAASAGLTNDLAIHWSRQPVVRSMRHTGTTEARKKRYKIRGSESGDRRYSSSPPSSSGLGSNSTISASSTKVLVMPAVARTAVVAAVKIGIDLSVGS